MSDRVCLEGQTERPFDDRSGICDVCAGYIAARGCYLAILRELVQRWESLADLHRSMPVGVGAYEYHVAYADALTDVVAEVRQAFGADLRRDAGADE